MPVSPPLTCTGLLHDDTVTPRSGGISFEVSSLTYFSELLDELNEVERGLEAGGDSAPRAVSSRIEDRLTNKHIRSGRLQGQIIVVREVDEETEGQTSTRTRRIFTFPAKAARVKASSNQ